MKKKRRHLARPLKTMGSASSALSPVAVLARLHAPWWAVAVIAAGGLLCVALSIVFPQDSLHRLKWWESQRRNRRIRAEQKARAKAEAVPPAVPPPQTVVRPPGSGQSQPSACRASSRHRVRR